jgi:hypothetical protein
LSSGVCFASPSSNCNVSVCAEIADDKFGSTYKNSKLRFGKSKRTLFENQIIFISVSAVVIVPLVLILSFLCGRFGRKLWRKKRVSKDLSREI